MFDLLKKKIGGFTKKLREKVAGETETAEPQPIQAAVEKPVEEPKPVQAKEQIKEEPRAPKEAVPAVEEQELFEEEPEEETPGKKIGFEEEPARELKAKVSAASKIKRIFGREIEIKESDLKDMLWELELSLLEADVEQTTAEEIAKEIKARLAGKKIPRGKDIDAVLKEEIGEALASMMKTEPRNVLKEINAKKEKPYKILFLGPNGAGKTTSMAKLTHLMQERGMKVLWSASDTFRAASIEQLETHAGKLGVRVVKHNYGADPAAVAFDAIKAAQSKGIEVVMIDSAGRQETDKNLMRELEKIVRVAQPDLKIYVGEAFTGQALLQQAQEYEKVAGIDGFILTKIDTDAKGGTTISLLYKLKKPVLFVGTGQEYRDLQPFTPEFVLKRIIG